MKHSHRFLALALVTLLLVPLVACAGDNGSTDTTTAQTNETTAAPITETTAAPEIELAPDLPEIRFDNTGNPKDAELVIIHNPASQQYYYECWIYAEEQTGDIINDAVYKRNMIIQDKYGIEIISIEDSNPANTAGLAAQALSDEYDIAMCSMHNTGTIALKGMLHNIADLPYVNYEMPWWDTNCANDTIIAGKLYGMVSDISMMTLSGVRGIIFNRDLAKDYNLEDPYTLVKENRWTLDKMAEMITAVSDDLDGDTAFTDADVYGMLTENFGNNTNAVHFVVASNIDFVQIDDNGDPKIAYNNEKILTVLDKCRAMFLNNDNCLGYDYLKTAPGLSGSYWTYGRRLFASDHFLFMQGGALLFDEISEFGMESEYGIVPNPKYDSNQENYCHAVDRNTSMLTIPSSNAPEDMERLGILLEDMAYQSSIYVKDAYYDIVIKLRRAEVPEMGEMMDIIKNSVSYQYENLYNAMALCSIIDQAFNTGDYASTIQANINKFEANLANTLQIIKDLP